MVLFLRFYLGDERAVAKQIDRVWVIGIRVKVKKPV